MSRPFLDSLEAIFIHVPKTGGVAIDRYFKEHCALDDFTGHHSARDLKAAAPEKFQSYFKFAFVRNPWERLLSAFCFLNRGGFSKIDKVVQSKHIAKYGADFGAFVSDLPAHLEFVRVLPDEQPLGLDGFPYLTSHFLEQAHWICDKKDTPIVDFIGRFERLDDDFHTVCQHLGLPCFALQKVNTSDHGDYRGYYSNTTARIVAQLYARDIELFGYRF